MTHKATIDFQHPRVLRVVALARTGKVLVEHCKKLQVIQEIESPIRCFRDSLFSEVEVAWHIRILLLCYSDDDVISHLPCDTPIWDLRQHSERRVVRMGCRGKWSTEFHAGEMS